MKGELQRKKMVRSKGRESNAKQNILLLFGAN